MAGILKKIKSIDIGVAADGDNVANTTDKKNSLGLSPLDVETAMDADTATQADEPRDNDSPLILDKVAFPEERDFDDLSKEELANAASAKTEEIVEALEPELPLVTPAQDIASEGKKLEIFPADLPEGTEETPENEQKPIEAQETDDSLNLFEAEIPIDNLDEAEIKPLPEAEPLAEAETLPEIDDSSPQPVMPILASATAAVAAAEKVSQSAVSETIERTAQTGSAFKTRLSQQESEFGPMPDFTAPRWPYLGLAGLAVAWIFCSAAIAYGYFELGLTAMKLTPVHALGLIGFITVPACLLMLCSAMLKRMNALSETSQKLAYLNSRLVNPTETAAKNSALLSENIAQQIDRIEQRSDQALHRLQQVESAFKTQIDAMQNTLSSNASEQVNLDQSLIKSRSSWQETVTGSQKLFEELSAQLDAMLNDFQSRVSATETQMNSLSQTLQNESSRPELSLTPIVEKGAELSAELSQQVNSVSEAKTALIGQLNELEQEFEMRNKAVQSLVEQQQGHAQNLSLGDAQIEGMLGKRFERLDKLSARTHDLLSRLETIVDTTPEKITATLNNQKLSLEKIEAQHQAQMEATIKAHQHQLDELTSKHEAAINSRFVAITQEQDNTQKASLQSSLDELKSEQENQLSEHISRHKETISELTRKFEEQVSAHNEAQEEALNELRVKQENELDTQRKTLEEIKEQHKTEIEFQKAQLDKSLSQIKSETSSQIKSEISSIKKLPELKKTIRDLPLRGSMRPDAEADIAQEVKRTTLNIEPLETDEKPATSKQVSPEPNETSLETEISKTRANLIGETDPTLSNQRVTPNTKEKKRWFPLFGRKNDEVERRATRESFTPKSETEAHRDIDIEPDIEMSISEAPIALAPPILSDETGTKGATLDEKLSAMKLSPDALIGGGCVREAARMRIMDGPFAMSRYVSSYLGSAADHLRAELKTDHELRRQLHEVSGSFPLRAGLDDMTEDDLSDTLSTAEGRQYLLSDAVLNG